LAAATAQLDLAAARQQDVRERSGFLQERTVATLEHAGAALVRRGVVEHGHGLAREREAASGRRSVPSPPAKAPAVSSGSAGRMTSKIRDDAQAGNRCHRLVVGPSSPTPMESCV